MNILSKPELNNCKLTIEFNKLLQEELKKSNKLDDNICLITKEPLQQTYITLSCKHKFNYDAIYREIYKQKIIKNYKEIQKLKKNHIKCPYCRNVQTLLLPHKIGAKKTKLVNWPPKDSMENPYLKNKCKYKFKSGKKKNECCYTNCEKNFCPTHLKYIERRKLKKNTKNKEKPIENEIIQKETFNIPKLKYACKTGIYSYFETTCDHCLTRGKNKGVKCNEIILIMITKNGFIKKKRLCNKHKNLKMYTNIQNDNIEPSVIPIFLDSTVLNENHNNLKTNENIKEFIKTNYTYYYNSDYYILKGIDHTDLTKLKFVKVNKI